MCLKASSVQVNKMSAKGLQVIQSITLICHIFCTLSTAFSGNPYTSSYRSRICKRKRKNICIRFRCLYRQHIWLFRCVHYNFNARYRKIFFSFFLDDLLRFKCNNHALSTRDVLEFKSKNDESMILGSTANYMCRIFLVHWTVINDDR